MRDYEDDVRWDGEYVCFFPVYQDLTLKQLRGFFSWRTHIRRGDYQRIATPAAYIYIFELLNGIGTSSPEESLRRMMDFEKHYPDCVNGAGRLRQNLRRWMKEFAIVKGLPAQMVLELEEPETVRWENALALLRSPQSCPDEALWAGILYFAGNRLERSPVLAHERGKHLFCEAWRAAAAREPEQGRDVFTLCFGLPAVRSWTPFSNAVYYWKETPEDTDYKLNECRTYRCRSGLWTREIYEKPAFDRIRFTGFLRETDLRLRRYLKTGRYLKEKQEDAWADPYIGQVIEADRLAGIEAAREKITIDLSGLAKIRQDADLTRDRLLYGEGADAELPVLPAGRQEPQAAEEVPGSGQQSITISAWQEGFSAAEEAPGSGRQDITISEWQEDSPAAEEVSGSCPRDITLPAWQEDTPAAEQDSCPELPLDAVQRQLLRALLRGEPVQEILRDAHLFPSLAADSINEALFDLIGDTALSCEDDVLSVTEDYREDLEKLLEEEKRHG